MKTFCFVAAFVVFSAAGIRAQLPIATTPQEIAARAPTYMIGESEPHHRIWYEVRAVTNELGQLITRTNRAYEEVATGLNYFDVTAGQWKASREEFEVTKEGDFVADKGQHHLKLAQNLNTPGAVQLTLPDGELLVSEPRFLSLFDASSGASVLIGQVKDCAGVLTASNVIVFPDCFEGIKGSIRYTFTRSGMSQDILVYENVNPADWGLTNLPAITLDMFSEFTSAPVLQKRTEILSVNLSDDTLDFPQMRVGAGQAFLWGTTDSPIRVCKSWQMLEDKILGTSRQFLIESVPYVAAEPFLNQLPDVQHAARKPASSRAEMIAGLPSKARAKAVASAESRSWSTERSFLIDYTTLNTSQTNYTFRGDTTYVFTGNVNLYGTNTTYEAGAVLKYFSNVTMTVSTPVTWLGTSYRPVVMTSRYDKSVGGQLTGLFASTNDPGNGYYAATVLYFDAVTANTNLVIQNLRVANARTAIAINGGSGHVLSHVQLLKCANGLALTNADLSLRNALFDHVLTNFTGSSSTGRVEHLTSDTAAWLNKDIGSNLFLTNCLLVAVTSNGNWSAFQNVNQEATSNGLFQTVGAGAHYLAGSSTNRDAGTTNINASLAASLRKLTTYPPSMIASNFTASTTLSPYVQRDTDVPDIGYHYDPLDYVWTNKTASSLLTLTNGVAIGFYGTNCLTFSGTLVSEGGPANMNRIAGYQCVQEQYYPPTGDWLYGPCYYLRLRFTDLPALGGVGRYLTPLDGYLSELTIQDSWLRGGTLSLNPDNSVGGHYSDPSSAAVTLLNNLFERCTVSLGRTAYSSGPPVFTPLTVQLQNNLFWRGSVALVYDTCDTGGYTYNGECGCWVYDSSWICHNPTWEVHDNAFDNVSLSLSGYGGYYTQRSNNGYINTTSLGGSGDVILTNFVYEAGPLGRWYQSTTNFINAGSTTADQVGLYHYTTRTNQTKEAGSTVDIGFHYVAVGGGGNPIDADGDGAPDYVEDKNGNGVTDSGETLWNLAILTQPTNQVVAQGACVAFSVFAAGTAPISYQWRFNTTNIVSETNAILIRCNIQTTNAGNYSVVVTNFGGSITSTTAVLTVCSPTLNSISDITVAAGSGPHSVSLTGIGAGCSQLSVLNITASSDNTSIIPTPSMTYTSPNTNGTLTFTPSLNNTGVVTISVVVHDNRNTNLINGGISTAGGHTIDSSDFSAATRFTSISGEFSTSTSGTYSSVNYGSPVLFTPFAFNPVSVPLVPLWVITNATETYSFNAVSMSLTSLSSGSMTLSGMGMAKINGFQDTPGTFIFTASTPGGGSGSLSGSFGVGGVDSVTRTFHVTVTNANLAPVISITFPTNLQHFTEGTNVTLTAGSFDPDGTNTSVVFYSHGTNLPFTVTQSGTNYSMTWSNRHAGTYPIAAIATDSRGASNVSEIAVFIVDPTNRLPIVAITYPTSNQLFAAGADITITATASSTNASITNVEFFVNGESIGSDPDAPYSITKCCWKAGNYTVVAKATDSLGAWAVTNIEITIDKEEPAGEGFWDPLFGSSLWTDASPPYAGLALAAQSEDTVFVGSISFTGLRFARTDDGTNWVTMGNAITLWHVIHLDGTNIYAGGENSSDNANGVFHWNGADWSQLGANSFRLDPRSSVSAIATIGSEIYIGGDFQGIDEETDLQYFAKYDRVGDRWIPVGDGLNGPVYAISSLAGEIYVGGAFTNVGGNPNANYIARLSGTNWVTVGTGGALAGTNALVTALAVCGSDLFVGGFFTEAAGDTNADGLAIWNGSEWRTLEGGVEPTIQEPSGYWNAFTPPRDPDVPYPHVYTLAVRGNRLFVGGMFSDVLDGTNSVSAENIAAATWTETEQRWTWSDLDKGVSDNVYPAFIRSCAIVEGANPSSYSLFVGGQITQVGEASISVRGVARWRVGYPEPAGAPKVTITNLKSPTIFTNSEAAPITVRLTGLAVSSYTNIWAANFYTNGVVVGTPQTPMYDYANSVAFTNDWYDPQPGVYLITATARDDLSLVGSSKPLVISIKDTNNPITAIDDQFTIPQGTLAATLPVLTNDSPSSGLKISQVTTINNNFGRVTIGHDGKYLTYTPFPNVFGTNIFYYTITNGTNADSASVTVKILARPVVEITAPGDGYRFTTSTAPVSITSFARDWDGSISNVAVYVNGLLYKTLTNNSGGNFVTNWTTNTAGFYTLVAVATDNDGLATTSAPVTLVAIQTNSSPHGPFAAITNLVAVTNEAMGVQSVIGPVIRDGLFDLKGNAFDQDGDAVSYAVFLLRPEDERDDSINDDPIFILYDTEPFANVTPGPFNPQTFHTGGDTNGDLGMLDLTGIPDGVYDLVLRVRGGTDETNAVVRVTLESQLKIGQFSFSEQDLVIPVNGIPLTVTRTYNSLNPRSGPFGASWTYNLNDMDVQLDDEHQTFKVGSDEVPFADIEEADNGLPREVSIRTGGGWDVTLNLPDGKRTTFAFTPQLPAPNEDDPSFDALARWTAPPGVTATLTNLGSDVIHLALDSPPSWHDGGDNSTFVNHDLPGWFLTTQDGTKYFITREPKSAEANVLYQDTTGHYINVQSYGTPKLTKIVQRSGDTITIDDDGVKHYANGTNLTRSVLIDHDAQGRIIALRDPNAETNGLPAVKYVYNQDNGNLLQVLRLVDRNAGTYTTTKYHYDNPKFPHYITSIEDPRGIPLARNEYDDSGRLTAVVDADGNRTEFVHNTDNNMEVIVDRLGHTNTYVYDLRGNVTAQTNALGNVTLMAYDDFNNKTNEIVYLNNTPYATNRFVCETNGWILASYNPLGFSNTFTYDANGQVLTSTDARGNSSTNYYDGAGNLIAMLDALGNATTNFYNPAGLLVGSRDAVGTLTTNYYDSLGNLTTSAVYAASTILSSNTFAYDDNGNRISSSVWRKTNNVWTAAITTYIYDAQNRVVQAIDPDGGTNTVVYNEIGKQQATIDKLRRTNGYSYDFQGRLVSTVYADGTLESSDYDAAGNRVSSVDRAGRTTSYAYDALNRLTNTVYADLTTSTTVYDDLGRVAYTIDARGTTNAFGYDVARRRVSVTNALGLTGIEMVSKYGYDANGNQITFTDAAGVVTTNVYDELNRQVQTLYPNGTKTSTGYDAAGRRVAETNQDGIVTLFGYDGAGRLISVTNAFNKAEQTVTRYDYDEAGNLFHQIDALNRTNTFTYDSLSRRIAHWMPDTNLFEKFSYDQVGNLIRHTNFNGAVITNIYDLVNRLRARIYPDGTSNTFTYTATGQRATMNDASGSHGYVYDLRDRLMTNTAPAGILYYSYDANGNLTSIDSSTASGTSVTYQYDALNRVTNVIDARLTGTKNTGYGFDSVGNLQRIQYPDGVTNLYQYDSLNRLTNLVWKRNGTAVGSFYYQLRPSGNRTNLSETVNGASRTFQWEYDNLYRLTNEMIGVTAPTGTLGYGYDAVGNRTNRSGSLASLGTQTLSYNTNDWLTTDIYDKNGNTRTNGSSQPYFYDYENRLTNFNNGQVVIVYDADGNRVKKITSTATNLYLVDTRNPSGYAQVLEELTINGPITNLTKIYTYGLDLISQRQPGTSTNFFGTDGHGSTRFLTDLGGNVVNIFVYDAYGTLVASNTTAQTVYLYCGEQFDPDLGFYYLRARYLNPNTGRFWTMDSFAGNNEDPLSLHKYVYGSANPINLTDPSGHFGDLITLIVGAVAANSLQSTYDATVNFTFLAMQHTIIGVQNHLTENQILKGYFTDVAIGVTIGIIIGGVADIAGDLVYGGTVEGEPITIEVNAQTVEGSRNFAAVESTTEDLLGAAGRTAKTVKDQTGLSSGPVYGTKVHTAFANDVEALGLNSEVSYLDGNVVEYGTPGSVRLDVVKGDKMRPQAIWDLKTGSAKLTPERIRQIRAHLPEGYKDIPIAEIRP